MLPWRDDVRWWRRVRGCEGGVGEDPGVEEGVDLFGGVDGAEMRGVVDDLEFDLLDTGFHHQHLHVYGV